DKYALPPELLELEITRDALEDDAAEAGIGRLVQLGVGLALDDFAEAQSPVSELRRYPIGVVKLDRALMRDVPQDAQSAAAVETSIMTAHALGKRVLAKGIERIEQLDFLREHRCDVVQGFYLARPLSSSAVMELLLARSGANADDAVREAG
ncbi:MAG: EAL domain-containing protein, partial [Steroidobacteraceae bacterium]